MHKNPLGRDDRARERGPHRSQEQVEILKELATLIAARTTRGRPGRASVAVQQCMTQFRLYSDFKMTPQEVNRVANLPEWTTVLEVMIKSRREDLAFRTTKQQRSNQRAQDRQAHQDFLEEHRGTGKFSGKNAPQPQQTELIWTMPWGCWVELEDKDVHCKGLLHMFVLNLTRLGRRKRHAGNDENLVTKGPTEIVFDKLDTNLDPLVKRVKRISRHKILHIL